MRYVTLKWCIGLSLFSRLHGMFHHWPKCALCSVINKLKSGVKGTTVGIYLFASWTTPGGIGQSQIPQCTYLISHKTPFRTEVSVFNGVSCIVVCVRLVYWCLFTRHLSKHNTFRAAERSPQSFMVASHVWHCYQC